MHRRQAENVTLFFLRERHLEAITVYNGDVPEPGMNFANEVPRTLERVTSPQIDDPGP